MPSGLALSNIAVMAENTLFCGLVVRKWRNHRGPSIGGMTSVTQIAGQWMVTRFEGARTHAIMASGTGTSLTGDGSVIKGCRNPGRH
jgi:hypothetical protein